MARQGPHQREERRQNSLSARLTRMRLNAGLTQQELAELAGMTQTTIQKIENGKSLRPRQLDRLATALDTHPAYLQYGVDVHQIDALVEAASINERTRKLIRRCLNL